MVVWSISKLGTELLEYLEPVLDVLDSPWTVWVVCVIIYAINYGLGVVGPKMAMDFLFHKVELMLGERAVHGQPTTRFGDC